MAAARYVKIDSPAPAQQYVAAVLRRHLGAGERVLWLISGGSVIKVAVEAARALAGSPPGRLTVSLADERPGPAGHPASNWRQLLDAGFSAPGAQLHPVLTGAASRTDAEGFDHFLQQQLDPPGFTFGLFGVGPDGHTAGLPAVGAKASTRLADYYESEVFMQVAPAQRDRISMTPAAIGALSEAVALVMGEAKHAQIDRLQSDLPYAEQSAQALKLAPKLTVFNDYKGESA